VAQLLIRDLDQEKVNRLKERAWLSPAMGQAAGEGAEDHPLDARG
jgi:hypothetical protein